ncbi:serine-rich coiled-coil domain-containing protein 2 [Salminus brasiliensis]|uniref:serine-rich coiled-coil domain-containing protein 2 n=1 Tax=Salminus brasiliensis TaxID=930266 RepID=UPI003B834414
MELKAPGKPSTVSRLPKFSSRPVNALGSLPKGVLHSRLTHEGRSISGNFSGVVRPSSISLNNRSPTTPLNQEVPGENRENRIFHPPGSRANKKSSTPLTTGRRSASTESPKPALRSSRSTYSLKAGSTSPHTASTSKLTQNGTTELATSGRGPRLQRLRDNPNSTDGLPQSSCALGMLLSDRMVRSQSFSHFRQPSPAASAIPRSFSFNKIVELAKPLPNTQLCPVRSPGLKPPQCITRSRLRMGFGKSFIDHSSAVAPLSGCSMPPSGLKKPSLPSCALSKPLSLAYRLTHTFSANPQSPLGGGTPERTLSRSDQDAQQFEKSFPAVVPDGSEEMSFSSASSDKNDACEDLLDDFYHLGDQSHNGMPDNGHLITPTLSRLHNFLDWVDLTGGAVSVSSDAESVGGSSLELSPSSSGGTYMWDEEMMEPFGHNTHSHTNNTHPHHCSSYNSRMDKGNNQESAEVFGLEENDFILALDLPENEALHSELKKGEPQQRRRGANHLQNDNWLLVLQNFNGPPAVHSDGHMAALQEFTLEQILQDCSSVKSQLLKLKNLLQMEASEMNSKEWSVVNSAPFQVTELLKEVTTLREELNNKDKIITQLTHKQQHKQQQQLQFHRSLSGSDVKGVKGQKADKFTQTPWRTPHILQKLQPSSPRPTGPRTQEPSAGPGTVKFSYHRGPQ